MFYIFWASYASPSEGLNEVCLKKYSTPKWTAAFHLFSLLPGGLFLGSFIFPDSQLTGENPFERDVPWFSLWPVQAPDLHCRDSEDRPLLIGPSEDEVIVHVSCMKSMAWSCLSSSMVQQFKWL